MAPGTLKRNTYKPPKLIKIGSSKKASKVSKPSATRASRTSSSSYASEVPLPPQISFSDLDKFNSLSSIPELICELASRIWDPYPDPKDPNPDRAALACAFLAKPYIRDNLAFQSKVPAAVCIPKTLLMGTKLATEDPTGVERELAKLAQSGIIWLLSVEARDVKEIIVLRSGMLENITTLCETETSQTTNMMEEKVASEYFGEPAAKMQNVDIYRLFREFLTSKSGTLRYITRSHFVDFENTFIAADVDLDTDEEMQLKERISDYKSSVGSVLWEYRNLLISAGYLTLVLEATNTGTGGFESGIGDGGSFRCAAVVDSTGDDSFSEFEGGISVDDQVHTRSIEPSFQKTEPVFRLSLPNVGALLSTVRVARKWILDMVLNRRRSSGDHNSSITSVASSASNNFRQITQSLLYEKWISKQKTAAFYRKFKGINLEYALQETYGGGWIEPLNTPVGICWKYSGKTMIL